MCGIAGIIQLDGQPVSAVELAEMNLSLVHRGPDDEGIWIKDFVGLAHRRLSIIDLAGGKQPMSNEDASVWISFNGEIYNFREIRRSLESKGHIFKTNSDTEVIVHLYEEQGRDCVKFLNGMFAFAIFDTKRQVLFLARDRLGKKPLVYFKNNSKFAFASELRALKKTAGMPREINLQALHDYFTLQYIPSPDTIYRNVFKLPPAHTLELNLSDGSLKIERYWECRYDKKSDLEFEDAKRELRRLVEDAVRMRLISDVPLGAFLSGGTDSTIITGIMSKITDSPVKTFTIGFEDKNYDERRFAKFAAAEFSTEHYERVVNPANFAALEKLVLHYGEPYSDASMLPTYLLSEFTREKVTVALSGDGADELFAGYYRYLAMKYANFADFLPLSARKIFCSILSNLFPPKTEERSLTGKIQRILGAVQAKPMERYLQIIGRFGEPEKNAVYGEKFKGRALNPTLRCFDRILSSATAVDSVEKIMELDLRTYLPGDILAKVDTASMACSLEIRNPFLDYRVAEFAASLPLSFKQNGKERKHILREAFADLIPRELKTREKLGFGVPVAAWLRGGWSKIVRENLLDGKAVSSAYFNRQGIEAMIKEHQSLKADHSYALWAILIFELWLHNCN